MGEVKMISFYDKRGVRHILPITNLKLHSQGTTYRIDDFTVSLSTFDEVVVTLGGVAYIAHVGKESPTSGDFAGFTNLIVAKAMIVNAKAYGESGDMATVMNNLDLIEECLKKPDEENTEYTWDDFK